MIVYIQHTAMSTVRITLRTEFPYHSYDLLNFVLRKEIAAQHIKHVASCKQDELVEMAQQDQPQAV